jgi:hypothetical protein
MRMRSILALFLVTLVTTSTGQASGPGFGDLEVAPSGRGGGSVYGLGPSPLLASNPEGRVPPRRPDPARLSGRGEACFFAVPGVVDPLEARDRVGASDRDGPETLRRTLEIRPRHGRFLEIEGALHVWVMAAWLPLDWDGLPTTMYVPCLAGPEAVSVGAP